MLIHRNSKSGITNKVGVYLILNIQTCEIYLGETLNLATRKATYMQSMREAVKKEKIFSFENRRPQDQKRTVIKLVQAKPSTVEDFLFVPVVISDIAQFKYKLTNEKAKNSDINKFLIEIEKFVLVDLLAKKYNLYNQKFGGLFEKNNTFGGSSKSGTSPAPVKIGAIAFETLSCAAKSLNVHSKSIRNYIKKFKSVDYLTSEQWLHWKGQKVIKGEEALFYKENPDLRTSYYRKPLY